MSCLKKTVLMVVGEIGKPILCAANGTKRNPAANKFVRASAGRAL
jgi:hypothetical protein